MSEYVRVCCGVYLRVSVYISCTLERPYNLCVRAFEDPRLRLDLTSKSLRKTNKTTCQWRHEPQEPECNFCCHYVPSPFQQADILCRNAKKKKKKAEKLSSEFQLRHKQFSQPIVTKQPATKKKPNIFSFFKLVLHWRTALPHQETKAVSTNNPAKLPPPKKFCTEMEILLELLFWLKLGPL